MFMPPEYLWLEPVLIAAAIVFVIDFFSNLIAFQSRLVNALVTAVIFAVVFGFMVNLGYSDMEIRTEPDPTAPGASATPDPEPTP
jgi:hypothetical protein